MISFARMPLRWRATLAFTVLGALLSLLFANAIDYIADDYESVLVEEILRGQADDYSSRLATDPATVLPQTHRLSGYLRRADGSGKVPAELRDLAPGFHESSREDQDGIHYGVFDTAVGRFYFVVDLRDIEKIENHLEWFSIAVIVLGTLLSGWLGWLLAGMTVAPVRRLSAAVESLPTTPQPSTLADAAGRDELGLLAQAIDSYQARLVEADSSERRFFADASHELRTPLAVVRGAIDVMLDDPATPVATGRRLHRLNRGMHALTDLIDMLLGLARRQQPLIAETEMHALLSEAAASIASESDLRKLHVSITAEGSVAVPRREALLLLRNVLRRLLLINTDGTLAMRYENSRIELTVTTAAEPTSIATPTTPLQRNDLATGVGLVGRLAAQINWDIEETAIGDSRCIRIQLPQRPPLHERRNESRARLADAQLLNARITTEPERERRSSCRNPSSRKIVAERCPR
ncbi:MAG: HAMP domain-containing sensor histidine kinase [Dokdonella sp.]